MKRIIVIGSGGAGKSTFAREVSERTGIEVIHLDREFWRPNWEKTPVDEWEAKVAEMLRRDAWIMDGNFGGTREMRMKAADTIIFLDLPRYICMYRVFMRTAKYYGRSRPDMTEGCYERLDLDFVKWVWNYPKQSKIRLLSEMERFRDKRVVMLKTKSDVAAFLDNLT